MLKLAGTLAAAVLALAAFAPPSAEASPHAGDRPLRVASFNIKAGIGPDRVLNLAGIAHEIAALQVDVVAIQEVDRHFGARSDFADEPAELARLLGWHVAYGANLIMDPLSPDAPPREYGTAVLSRFPILDSENVHLPNLPGLEQRGLLRATINVAGVKVDVYNTHLQHDDESIRRAQAERVVELVTQRSCTSVLMGDLNATPDERPHQIIAAALTDAWSVAGSGPGLTYPAEAPIKRIDYVFTGEAVSVHAIKVGPAGQSDHRPVVAELTVDGHRVGHC